MLGMMMHRPLLISGLIEHAARFHGDAEIVSRNADRSIFRYTYAEAEKRAKQLAKALIRWGIKDGDRVATLAWNNHRHFELYYGISGMGAVIHTINPRLVPEQIKYMIEHAEDQALFFDVSFLPIVKALAPQLKGVKHFVVMAEDSDDPAFLSYEALIRNETPDYEWPQFSEERASSLCYTSGTAGNPKGVLYSHRSTVLHAMAIVAPQCFTLDSTDSLCPVVPMFHVNAWGTPYAAAYTGCKFVLPGQYLDGESLCTLWRQEGVTITLGVPSVWQGALRYVEEKGGDFGKLDRVVIGGSAAPKAMIEAFEERYGVQALHAWGMTEMSPLGTVATFKYKHNDLSKEERRKIRACQGRPPYLIDMKIVDENGVAQPHDGVAVGELHVRGPWIASGYFHDEAASKKAFDQDGWFKTGDVAAIDTDGYLHIKDRSKDLIKSGGEWISSIDLENAALAHEDIAYAAVIGVYHPKWEERPLMMVVLKEGRTLDKESLLQTLAGRVAKWWLPDDIVAIEQIPFGPTGKILKTKLREQFGDYKLPTA
jgi:acyl-CoA synthetase (AMP-forming)/AMP-acid ligase II